MRLGLVAALLTLSLLPTAAAQVPEVPDPEDAILLLCGTVGGVEPQARELLPVCPRVEPAAPGANAEAGAPAPPAAPEAPEAALDLAGQAIDTATGVAEDPASAPERLLTLLDTIVRFVKDLLDLPAAGAAEVDASIREVQGAVKDAAATAGAAATDAGARAAGAVKDAASAVASAVASIFDTAEAPRTPLAKPSLSKDAEKAVSELPLDELRQVLPEG